MKIWSIEKLAENVALHVTTRGQDTFQAFLEMLTYLKLPPEKLAGWLDNRWCTMNDRTQIWICISGEIETRG